MTLPAGFDDNKRYWVTVTTLIPIMPRLQWKPGAPIQAQGSIIRQLHDDPNHPEYADAIEVGNEVPPEEAV